MVKAYSYRFREAMHMKFQLYFIAYISYVCKVCIMAWFNTICAIIFSKWSATNKDAQSIGIFCQPVRSFWIWICVYYHDFKYVRWTAEVSATLSFLNHIPTKIWRVTWGFSFLHIILINCPISAELDQLFLKTTLSIILLKPNCDWISARSRFNYSPWEILLFHGERQLWPNCLFQNLMHHIFITTILSKKRPRGMLVQSL